MNRKKEDWAKFCRRIIETNGNPSTKDAEDCNIPFSKWFELAARYSNDSKRMVAIAKTVLKRLEVNKNGDIRKSAE